MSDYLGPNQTRVLDSTNHSFESIVYQKQKPPLSSEVNLAGKIDSERTQQIVQTFVPSGWNVIGQLRDNVTPTQCGVGDVLCNSDCSGNSLLFIAQNLGLNTEQNVAFVNGWRVVVQGSNSPTGNGYVPYTNSTEDNLIRLPNPPVSGSRIDFVFLEVWRKLVDTTSQVYQYGNVDYHGSPFSNDLVDPARGFETSRRIQLQYRIRVSTIDDIDLYPEGFCPSVYVQGPLTSPISTCSDANFTQSSSDPGLWIAGSGDTLAQETLQTVDGHTYAIPMFAIRRRNTQAFDPRIDRVNGASYSVADYRNGVASDRPDNLYNDWIVTDDIVDLRHHVIHRGELGSLCNKAFRSLQNNSLKSRMGYATDGGEQNGSVMMKIDCINQVSNSWSHFIASGTGSRRWFANASGTDGTVSYPASSVGLSEVPTLFLEARKIETYPTTMYPIAMKDQDIRVRYGTAAVPFDSSDLGTQYNMLRARGGSYSDLYNFGHQMVYHTPGTGSNTVIISRNISGYDILGVASIITDSTAVQNITVITRDASYYTITLGSIVPAGNDIEMILYTGNKFFDGNKQGRGITDCYQMVELQALETPDGMNTSFTIDSSGYDIMALNSYANNDGTGYAYAETLVSGTRYDLTENNRNFPDGTRTTVTFNSAPTGDAVKVPVLLRSAIQSTEGYAFFYEYIPYQGLNDASGIYPATGSIEAVGPSITTSTGSGGIANYTRSYTSSGLFLGTNLVTGSGTDWLATVRSGYLLSSGNIDPSIKYKVKNVLSNTLIELDTTSYRTSAGLETIVIDAPDVPLYNYPNTIDRFPTLHTYNDHSGNSGVILDPATVVQDPTLESRIIARVQDVVDAPVNTIQVGVNNADRGRSTINILSAPYGGGSLGLKFETVDYVDYKKTYQSYILNKDNCGRLYLMVVGSETDNVSTDGSCFFNAYSFSDVVDLFEIPGRPLITGQ